jgi:hypothetical protein
VRKWILAVVSLTLLVTTRAITLDATREQVIAELGNPVSQATRGTHEILLYPKGVRVELENGRVVAAQGLALDVSTPTAPVTLPAEKPAVPPPPVSEPEPSKTADVDISEYESPAATAKPPPGVNKTFDALIAAQEQSRHPPPAPKFDVRDFAVGLVLRFLMTLAALRIACKYWQAEVFLSGLLIVAAVESVMLALMNLAAEWWLGFPTLFYADEAISGVVMLMLLKKLSINQSTNQAIQLTLTTKTFTVVVGSFLITVLLRLLHSH